MNYEIIDWFTIDISANEANVIIKSSVERFLNGFINGESLNQARPVLNFKILPAVSPSYLHVLYQFTKSKMPQLYSVTDQRLSLETYVRYPVSKIFKSLNKIIRLILLPLKI